MASKRESNRPLFHRFQNREAINFRSSIGKQLLDNNNVAVFAGELALNNPLGTFWPDLAQAGAIAITVGEDAEIGGCDRVKITANGDAITLDGGYTWNNIGTDAISIVNNDINIIICLMVSATEINYCVKVNP